MADQLLTTQQVAEIFDKDISTIWRWHKRGMPYRLGKLQAKMTVGGRALFDPEYVKEVREKFEQLDANIAEPQAVAGVA
jgi:transposase